MGKNELILTDCNWDYENSSNYRKQEMTLLTNDWIRVSDRFSKFPLQDNSQTSGSLCSLPWGSRGWGLQLSPAWCFIIHECNLFLSGQVLEKGVTAPLVTTLCQRWTKLHATTFAAA
jgi:hypothetical protein